jgi:hypothetical protein
MKDGEETERQADAHRRIFNDELWPGAGGDISFPQFRSLPAELRIAVWNSFLCHHRFIHVRIYQDGAQRASGATYASENSLGNLISEFPCSLEVVGGIRASSSPLLLVNHEARRASQEFYRVRLPLLQGGNGRLLMNPDYDVLYVQTHFAHIDSVVALLHDVRAHDPLGVGVSMLAMGSDIRSLRDLDPERLPELVSASLCHSLSGLKMFFAVVSLGRKARLTLGSVSYTKARMHHNRSIPVAGQTGSLDWLKSDPRPIDFDLSQVALGADPRSMEFHWKSFESRFGIQRDSEAADFQFRYILAIWPNNLAWPDPSDPSPSSAPLQSREGVLKFLRQADTAWDEWMKALKRPIWGDTSEALHSRLQADLKDVAGFWVFPEQTFGEIPDSDGTEPEWQPATIQDLSQHRPGLAVFKLSRTSDA